MKPKEKTMKRLARISSAALRLAIGIGGAIAVFLAIKDHAKLRTSKSKEMK